MTSAAVDWSALSDAYGQASDIPFVIADLSTETADPRNPVWEELWGRLCHQGTVYTASYAALPLLLDHIKLLTPEKRAMPLMLVGAIISSDDLVGVDTRPHALIDGASAEALLLTEQCMDAGEQDHISFIHLLAAACAFKGELFWARNLDCLIDGELPGHCPSCAHELHLVIGADGFFVTTEEWIGPNNSNPKRSSITPAEPASLCWPAAWLHQTAIRYNQPNVARSLCHLFGTAECPSCRQSFDVARTAECD